MHKYIKKYRKFTEDIKNNLEGTLINQEDIMRAILTKKDVYVEIIKDLPNHDRDTPVRAIGIDDDGTFSVDIDGNIYQVDLTDVIEIK